MKTINFKFVFFLLLASCVASCAHAPFEMGLKVPVREIANFQDCYKIMETFLVRPIPLKAGLTFATAKDLDELESLYGNASFIETQRSLPNAKILEINKKTRELLSAPLRTDTPDGYTNYLTKEELDLIYKDAANEKVNVDYACYDPKGAIGFCFGRATIVHMEALIRGVNPDSIRKIWIAGDMDKWGHHVATMIKGKDGWYVIDSNLGRVVKAEEWIDFYKPYKSNKSAKDIMVFITRADRFSPEHAQNYSQINLFNTATNFYERTEDYYRGFFVDYFDSLDKERKEVKKFPVRK